MINHGKVVHLRTHPCDVRIDRTTAWGNPFVLGKDGGRNEVIEKFREWVTTSDSLSAVWIRENVHTLYGQTLGCWCAPRPCHGDVLLELAAQAVYARESDPKDDLP